MHARKGGIHTGGHACLGGMHARGRMHAGGRGWHARLPVDRQTPVKT